MKYLLTILFLITVFISSEKVYTAQTFRPSPKIFARVPEPLKNAVDILAHFPDSKALIEQCTKEGPITLEWLPLGKNHCQACWIGDERVIILNSSKEWNMGAKISSIIFELHNAKSDQTFIRLNKQAYDNQISKEYYVKSVEEQEYKNSLSTKQILQKGISLGYFPKTADLPIYDSFEEHFKWQQALGHSALIAEQYDIMRTEALRLS